jgi:hypothetical protein
VPGEVTLVAVTRAGRPRLDLDGLVGQEGDVLTLMVARSALPAIRTRLAGVSPEVDALLANEAAS